MLKKAIILLTAIMLMTAGCGGKTAINDNLTRDGFIAGYNRQAESENAEVLKPTESTGDTMKLSVGINEQMLLTGDERVTKIEAATFRTSYDASREMVRQMIWRSLKTVGFAEADIDDIKTQLSAKEEENKAQEAVQDVTGIRDTTINFTQGDKKYKMVEHVKDDKFSIAVSAK